MLSRIIVVVLAALLVISSLPAMAEETVAPDQSSVGVTEPLPAAAHMLLRAFYDAARKKDLAALWRCFTAESQREVYQAGQGPRALEKPSSKFVEEWSQYLSKVSTRTHVDYVVDAVKRFPESDATQTSHGSGFYVVHVQHLPSDTGFGSGRGLFIRETHDGWKIDQRALVWAGRTAGEAIRDEYYKHLGWRPGRPRPFQRRRPYTEDDLRRYDEDAQAPQDGRER